LKEKATSEVPLNKKAHQMMSFFVLYLKAI